ncbi:hypothetical protein PGTUg99_013902 [Puccinia graminis f. sp. tritici]|uniref:HAT C-terminal dimerisation domain-containing protein n=1 Tax=Puccinia graminis f. sp. tritici TaxID=56615 RepID=A0A5B0PE46_PUCGR|nr:hypothetical protein PGTUg99_013902 [Puccinia graminis f. sp. tritici]
MEGDGPSCSMVLYKYSCLIDTLDHLKVACQGGLLEAMFEPMRTKAIKYRDLALKCEPILMATMLHPAWRLLLFANKFQSHHTVAQALLLKKFKERQAILGPPTAPTAKEAPSPIDPEDEGYNFYPSNPGTDDGEDELNRYHKVKYSLGIKGNILAWWKHAELTLHRQAEESGGALVESLAFRGAGKRRKVNRMHKVLKSLLRGVRASADAGDHGRLRNGGSGYTAEGLQGAGSTEGRKRGSERTRGGSGGGRPDLRAAGGVPGPTGVGGVTRGVRGGDSG